MEEEGRIGLERCVVYILSRRLTMHSSTDWGECDVEVIRSEHSWCRSGDMDTPQDTGEMGSRKRGRNGSASSASRRHIQTEQKRRDKINEGCAGLLGFANCATAPEV